MLPRRQVVRACITQDIVKRFSLADVLRIPPEYDSKLDLVVHLIVLCSERNRDDAIGIGEGIWGFEEEDGNRGEGEVHLGLNERCTSAQAGREGICAREGVYRQERLIRRLTAWSL